MYIVTKVDLHAHCGKSGVHNQLFESIDGKM